MQGLKSYRYNKVYKMCGGSKVSRGSKVCRGNKASPLLSPALCY